MTAPVVAPLDLVELRRTLDEMTPGPWAHRLMTDPWPPCEEYPTTPVEAGGWFTAMNAQRPGDAAGIVALRNAAPALLAEVRAARERIGKLEAGLRDAEAYVCRATLAANLPREAWSDACHAHTILRALLPTEGVKP